MSSSPPPPVISYRPITPATLPQLKCLNAALFPVAYRDAFYAQCLAAGELTHGAFVEGGAEGDGELVGAVAVRLEARDGGAWAEAYVMTVGVRAGWRGRGIGNDGGREKGEGGDDEAMVAFFFSSPPTLPFPGTRLLTNVLDGAAADPNVRACYLHVQVCVEREGDGGG